MNQADIGLIGLAVMGENLALNMESRGFTVAVFNRTVAKVDDFSKGRGHGKKFIGAHSLGELIAALKKPRRVMLMVKAGKPVDEFIAQLVPLLDPGDIIIDGGNSHFPDTIRRTKTLESKGLLFIGTGVSGGEEGALKGPSMMPGGSPAAWPHVKNIFQKICARVEDGAPCCEWVGNDGAGHFVKMVHNGIEYGDMQLICEAYQVMSQALGMPPKEMHKVFRKWNQGELDSYLIEITADILAKTDPETGRPMVDVILDTAGQKGTGKWTSEAALDLGVPAPTIAEAVFARCLSAIKEERVAAAKHLPAPKTRFRGNRKVFVEAIRRALYAAKICSYAQGYALMAAAARENNWDLHFGEIALMWRGGCIIRARFLGKIKEAFDRRPDLPNLMLDRYFTGVLKKNQDSLRKVVIEASRLGIPMPAFCSALAYFDGYRSARLPANLLQAQRDYFGAHTYERVDRKRGEMFHTEWLA
ncbi:MAG: decarboxylating NADP(+)-dependent phosphogluconate dehydrogenase [Verrucomicrobia bacterium]|nr:decarboxylating NADP(+)-dependent phosphogluconate dehydrogenase [Verrucomicrobiota bacterium]MCG2680141.1 decarboxylating NADP(+)-dependent phosphogluconate dehydrogenase [Kiritimatiellia bacterium]MBU4247050.1 decarboxylating NADP(+)-dependent phosphogluconate dehydrogenase [Verrucomicrobiota bacterium]MBU4291124.1 decarboxylating NADP(+)-dependent phosphogluconate dehydrogenase [Verrucomicrobiota bacterium]MBU4429300.1 decarboxylating NADP(+)-dependent phosphogluconate dehydrogenase [Verr